MKTLTPVLMDDSADVINSAAQRFFRQRQPGFAQPEGIREEG